MKTFNYLLILSLSIASASAQVIVVNDTFTDGTATNSEAEAPDDTLDIPWLAFTGTTSVETKTGFGATGNNVMKMSSANALGTLYSTTNGTDVFTSEAASPTIVLGATTGSGIRLSLQYFTASGGHGLTTARFFDVGLYSSGATKATDTGSLNTGDDSGYYASIAGVDNVDSNKALRLFRHNVAVDGAIDGGSGNGTVLGTLDLSGGPAGEAVFAEFSTVYNVRLELERITAGTNGQVKLTVSVFDNATTPALLQTLSATDTTGAYNTFDEISLYYSNNPTTHIDNVKLETFVVPEPSTFVMLLGGVCLLALRRRRS